MSDERPPKPYTTGSINDSIFHPEPKTPSAIEEAGGWKHWIEQNAQGSVLKVTPLKTWPLSGSVTRR